MLALIKRAFKRITDYRVPGRTKHPLIYILLIVTLAILSGCRTWKEIHTFTVQNFTDLKRRFMPDLESVPSVDTISRTISKLNPSQLVDALASLATQFFRRTTRFRPGRRPKGSLPTCINLDGKVLRGATMPGQEKSDVNIVSAVVGLVTLVCGRVTEKKNEITVFPLILETLHKQGLLAGKVVTIDAMGCQKSLVKLIRQYRANYLLNLKGNQGNLHKDVQSLFKDGPVKYKGKIPFEEYFSDFQKSAKGGWMARRITMVRIVPGLVTDWLQTYEEWDGLSSVLKVETFSKPELEAEPRLTDTRYFISSLALECKQMLELTINHWQVETNHKVLDDKWYFNEDSSKIYRGAAPEIWSIIVSFSNFFTENLIQLIFPRSPPLPLRYSARGVYWCTTFWNRKSEVFTYF
jgi:predicted transposase YbfD/YdcC